MKINLLVSENNIAEIQLNKQKGDKENLIWMSQEDAVQLVSRGISLLDWYYIQKIVELRKR